MKTRLLVVRPTLGQGGADRNTTILLRLLDRRAFGPITLALMQRRGEFVDDVPPDVEVVDLGASSLWKAWRPLQREIERRRPDVVLSTSSGTNLAAALAHQAAGSRARLVLSERNTVTHGETSAKRHLQTLLKRALYPRADAIAVISECLKHDVVATLGIPEAKIHVVYNPVVDDTLRQQAAEPVSHPWFSEATPVIVAAGRFVAQKDYPTLLRAFQIVRARRPARLFALGDGPLRGEIEAMARSLGIANDVSLPGFDKNPFKFMSRASVFVLSSVHEGFGSVIVQAMACGAPVVSTDCPCGPSEIIASPGSDGLLVPVGDARALAEQILKLLDDPELRQAMGDRARASAERFRAPAIVERYTTAILGDPARAAA
jgi:glycosyltransferase involved in cell wall biosynthesis